MGYFSAKIVILDIFFLIIALFFLPWGKIERFDVIIGNHSFRFYSDLCT
jgi:hypothetical protein